MKQAYPPCPFQNMEQFIFHRNTMYKPIFYEIGLKELMRICVVGAGYVGLTTAVALAVFGHEVQYVDIDQEKINNLLKMSSNIRTGLRRLDYRI
ncbi:3-hydroxyacyl-CoA dehydrogenase NAD-binding domain-containing protein [Dehalobacter sp. 12DCB1]|uniref:3-hydroxyacyl-CoA dehydrogenase NAD-binding domain-containing protein n=2 Tax=unclassified Dehalobacter TaxID=2635733 RepID=UPI001FAAFF0E|nr:3-hydroxyacyl-CoA dehydrogenase NAD-binding domain-containing protein [Dehalobacter sp. 12DCB1]